MLKKTSIRNLTLGAAVTVGLIAVAAPANAAAEVEEPAEFTSAFTVMATPDQVINPDGEATPGQEGATGTFMFRVNSELEIICYDITLEGVSGDYQSPAATATHIHEAAAGEPGPPRIAFPNPATIGEGPRTSAGCLQEPFTTGVTADSGADTGEGFSLAQLEADPAAFSADSHTVDFVPGVVRGQLASVPLGGVDTGVGATASATDTTAMTVAGLGIVALLGGLGVVAYRRQRTNA